MRFLIDEYQKNWAIRYLREAESDLSTAEKTPILPISVNLAILAMRKMQTAIYYCLGDPSYLAPIVGDALGTGGLSNDSLMRFLIQVEWLIQVRSAKSSVSDKEEALKEAGQLIEMASKMVEGIIGEELG